VNGGARVIIGTAAALYIIFNNSIMHYARMIRVLRLIREFGILMFLNPHAYMCAS